MSNISETLEQEIKELQEVKDKVIKELKEKQIDKDKQTAEKIMNAVIKK